MQPRLPDPEPTEQQIAQLHLDSLVQRAITATLRQLVSWGRTDPWYLADPARPDAWHAVSGG